MMEIFTYSIANFILILAVKEFSKSVNIWQSYCQKQSAPFFRDTVYNRWHVQLVCDEMFDSISN